MLRQSRRFEEENSKHHHPSSVAEIIVSYLVKYLAVSEMMTMMK